MANQLKKYGREESKEHGVSLRLGEKLAKDHIRRFGPAYYPALERLEKRFDHRKTSRKRKK